MKALVLSLLKKIGLAMFGIAFALIMLEVLARIFHIGSGGFWEPYPLYGWRNIPYADGWESCYGECAVHVKINSKGLRDREIPYEKEPGQMRILFLGDSMTAGMQVPLEGTFAKALEAGLNRDRTGETWEVINGAVNGFGTDNELLFYRLEGYKYQPDIVILGVYLANDIYNNSRELELRTGGSEHKPFFVLNESNELVLQNFPVKQADSLSIQAGTFLKRHFQLPRFVAEVLRLRGEVPAVLKPLVNLMGGARGVAARPALANGSNRGQVQRGDICDEAYTPEIEQAWAVTKALIKQMRAEVEASGAELAVLVIPASPQVVPPADGVSWYCDRPNIELTSFLQDEGIPYLDMLEAFRENSLQGGPTLYYQRDFHMNADGHRLAGELLNQFVKGTFIDPM